jgi:hypothetical protein
MIGRLKSCFTGFGKLFKKACQSQRKGKYSNYQMAFGSLQSVLVS